jgi:hypothetical protein
LNFIEGIQQHDGWFDNARLQQEIDQNKAEVNLKMQMAELLGVLNVVISHRQIYRWT